MSAWSRTSATPSAGRLLEIPAGTLDPGESPDSTAGRELAEETGYRAGSIKRIAEWLVSPGVMNERMYLYLCEELEPGPTDHQPDETLETVILPWPEAIRLVLRRRDRGRQDAARAAALRPDAGAVKRVAGRVRRAHVAIFPAGA